MIITDFDVAIVPADTHLSRWITEQRRLDVQAEYCRLFQRYIPAGGVVLDVGACLGDHTLSYSQMVGPTGRVHAFEPNPAAFECLAYNMRKHPNVTLHQLGLWVGETRMGILPSPTQPFNLGATMLDPTDETIKIARAVALDTITGSWPRIDFIKIDAEGCEPWIIAGAFHTLNRLRPVVLVELNRPVLARKRKTPRDVTEPLERLGYCIMPSEPHHSLEWDEVDALCLPSEIYE